MFLDNPKPDADGRHFGRRLVFEKDPANRRINMGNPAQRILHIIPMTVPQIVTNANGSRDHSFHRLLPRQCVEPAADEILSLFAIGLGPVRGGVTGQPFPLTLRRLSILRYRR
jgi:hypothetical protein